MRLILLTLALCALALPALADGSARKCVRTFDLRNYESIDDYHVLITGRTNAELYLVTMRRSCRDIDNSTRLVTSFANKRTCPPFAEFIQTEDDLCPVQWIQSVKTREQALALAKKDMDARARAKGK